MGPLQYMVIGYDPSHFRDDVLPELNSLSHRNVIRLLDILFVHRGHDGEVSSQELTEVMPEQHELLASLEQDEWFTQEDVAVVGENLPNGCAVALLLFEHCWAFRLEEAASQANEFLDQDNSSVGGLTTELEHLLTVGMGAHART
jgi:hypothetical protein